MQSGGRGWGGSRYCGRRPYLHDDWEAVRLDEALIAAPPIEIWPEIVARAPIPEDVEQGLIAQRREERKQGAQ